MKPNLKIMEDFEFEYYHPSKTQAKQLPANKPKRDKAVKRAQKKARKKSK